MTHPRDVLRGLEQRARRRFGQNFLVDTDLAERIVRCAGVATGDRVVEVGPGLGMLTDALLAAGADLTAVELYRDLAAFLRVRLPGLRLVEADAMKLNWAEVCEGSGWQVVANLPFNVGTPLVAELCRRREIFSRFTVMLQKEVVDRLLADPGTKAYGALTVRVQARAAALRVLSIPPSAFHPPPKVSAAVIRLDLLDEPRFGAAGGRAFDRVVRAAFTARRKKMVNSLAPLYGKEAARLAMASVGLAESVRAERVDVDGFAQLTAALHPGGT